LSAVLVRDTPTFGAYFMVYDAAVEATAKAMSRSSAATLLPKQPDASNRVLWTSQLVGGAAAGLACWTLALPMDVVKSVIQAAPLNQASPSIASAISSVYRRAGIAGFWAGAAPCLLRAVPTNAVTFFVFEYIKEFATRS
jgi:solute carrier family 25 carnitine/acylcarnitine transporter 20/29